MRIYHNPVTLARVLAGGGGIPASRLPLLGLYLLKSCAMLPGCTLERLLLARRIERTPIEHPPLFLLGHHRSGTTLLHKLLTADRQWAFIDTFDWVMPFVPVRLKPPLKRLLQGAADLLRMKHLHFRDYAIDLDDPIEEDMLMISTGAVHSAFYAELLPRRAERFWGRALFFEDAEDEESWKRAYLYFLRRVSRRLGGRPLLLKSPPNTGRVKALVELFPDARFVFIYRNPYQVYYSTRKMWDRTIQGAYALQKVSPGEGDEFIFRYYERLLSRYEEHKRLIPPRRLVELRYEDLEDDPMAEIIRIYRELELPGFQEAREALAARVRREASYRAYGYAYDDETQARVYRRWGRFIDRWRYPRLPVPAAGEAAAARHR